MRHIKAFENIDSFIEQGGTEDEYLESPDYFIETYFNGNFSQLHNMLSRFRETNSIGDLVDILKDGKYYDIIEWIAKN